MKIYVDVETSGLKPLDYHPFNGLHTIQYSIDRKPVEIIRVSKASKSQLNDFLDLLTNPNNIAIGYNFGFDIYRLYKFFRPKKFFTCKIIDLWNHLVTGHPYNQFPLVSKKEVVRLKRIPKKYSPELTEKITGKIKEFILPGMEVKIAHHEEEEDFLETLGFTLRVSRKLKDVIEGISDNQEILKFDEVLKTPKDFGLSKENTKNPLTNEDEQKIYDQVWQANEEILDNPNSPAYQYMKNDIEFLFLLEDWLGEQGNKIEPNINDTCTHIVAATKYFGFSIKTKEAQELKEKMLARQQEIKEKLSINVQSYPQRLELVKKHLLFDFPLEKTSAQHLNILLKNNLLSPEGVEIVKMLIEYNPLNQRIKQLEVFNLPRIYPDFRVIGTPTNRMAGTGGINFQGVSRESDIRSLVEASMGGDFDGLEITIAAKVFDDKQLTKSLEQNIDVHSETASLVLKDKLSMLFSEIERKKVDPTTDLTTDLTKWELEKIYDWVIKNKSNPKVKELRNKGKAINFLVIYFGTNYKLSEILESTPEEAEEQMNEHFFSRYPQLKKTRSEFYKKFCTADFETWDKESVSKMQDKVEDIFGNKRIIKFEKELANYFWSRSDEIASVADGDEERIIRTEHKGKQLIKQTIRSACLGAASTIQKSLYRMLGNFHVQTPGATLTKMLMVRLWNKFHVPMMNVHDELLIPKEFFHLFPQIQEEVRQFIKEMQLIIPHLSMEFKKIKLWSDK